MSTKHKEMTWSGYNTDVAEIEIPYGDDDFSINARNDFNGKNNTLTIVSTYTNDTSNKNAAIYCNSYTTDGTSAGDWYLPAAGELYSYVYGNYKILSNTYISKLGWDTMEYYFSSSSEHSLYIIWYVAAYYNHVHSVYKYDIYSVTCFLPIN